MDAASFERQRLSLFERYGLLAQSRWVVDGLGRRIYVAERVGTGRPVVLVHGGLSQGGDWCLMAGRLSGPVVIPDRPGWGLTYPIDHRRVNFREASAQWLGVVLDGLGLEQVDLVGLSAGGFVAAAFALTARPLLWFDPCPSSALYSVLGAPVPKCCPSVASVEAGWAAGGFVSRMHVVERLREWDFCTDSGAAALRAFHRQRPA